jgi:lipase
MSRLHLHEWGTSAAEPVAFCIHGVTGHGARFRKLAEERLIASHRILAPDLRGHGRSRWEPPWNLDAHVQDVAETADDLGVGRAAWLGFSFGGRVVAELAHRNPERVERLVLLDPALELPPCQCLEAAEEERVEEEFGSPEEAIEARLASGTLISTPRELLEEEMREHLVAMDDGRLRYRYSKSAAVAAWGEMAMPAPPVAEVPTLFVLGDQSYLPNRVHAERYRAALGAALTLHSVRSGHSVLWDAFDATADAVAEFVA